MDKRVGIIDLGSNTVRLVIFEVKPNGAFRLIDDICDTIRLSEKMVDGKYLNDFAMRKAVKTVKLFKKLCQAYNIPNKNISAVATAAVRKAENRDQFLKLLQSSSGLIFRVLSSEEEALYVYKAVFHSLDIPKGIIVDIGGGSTEIIKFENRNIAGFTSIPVGAIVATETYLDQDIIPQSKIEYFEKVLEALLSQHSWLTNDKDQVIIGLGGTIRTLAKIHRKKIRYPLGITHSYQITMDDFYAIYDHLKGIDNKSRKKIDGMSSRRADIIVGGLAILKSLSEVTSAKHLVISGYGLREGILIEYIQKYYPLRRFSSVLNSSLENYMDFYPLRREHSNHLCHLALTLFDQLQAVHNYGERERVLLMIASLLHDVGISISYYQHYRHTFYIILNSSLNGLSHREIVLTAAIASCHGSEPSNMEWYKKYKKLLQSEDIKIFHKLSVLLKLAECFDRSETGIIKKVECQTDKDSIKIKTYSEGDADLEITLASENAEDFKKVFNKILILDNKCIVTHP